MLNAKFVRVSLAGNHRVDPCAITGTGANLLPASLAKESALPSRTTTIHPREELLQYVCAASSQLADARR